MSRARRYLLVALLVLSAALAAASAAWLGCSTEGMRWLLGAVSDRTSIRIEAKRVEGRLLGPLRLTGVRIIAGKIVTEIDDLNMHWRPWLILSGRVSIKDLTLDGVRITDNSPPSGKPLELQWPRLPRLSELLDVNMKSFRVRGISYHRNRGETMVADSMATSLAWRFRFLTLRDLEVKTPSGVLKGNISAGFNTPLLKTDLTILPAHPDAAMEKFTIRTRLAQGKGKEDLAGNFSLSALPPSGKGIDLTGETGISRHSVSLRKLQLVEAGRRGKITGEGVVNLEKAEPKLDLRLKCENLDIKPETGMPTGLSGDMSISGDMDHYAGAFSLANMGKGWREGSLKGGFTGNRGVLNLTGIGGRLLDGRVTGNLEIKWEKGISVAGKMTGMGLDPARIDPEWKGVLNFDLSGSLAREEKRAINWMVAARLKESRLHGQALTGEVQAESLDGDLHIGHLLLIGRGFDIEGGGELKKKVDITVRIKDLSRLVPGTEGRIAAQGWMRWRDGRGAGAVSLHGTGLAASGIKTAVLDLSGRLDEGKGHPVHLQSHLSGISRGGFHLDSANIAVDGTLLKHSITAALFAKGAEARISLSGGYENRLWQGDIIRLSGNDGVGPWAMAKQTRLAISADRLFISPMDIVGSGSEHLDVAGQLQRQPHTGDLRLKWEGLNLARISRWMKDARTTGSSSGNLTLNLAGGDRLDITGAINATGTITAEKKSITVQRGSLTLQGDVNGVRAVLDLRTTNGGVFSGVFSSLLPARPGLPEQGDFSMEWKNFDLMLLRPWMPEQVGVDGILAGKARGRLLSGRRLEMDGETAIANGNIRWSDRKGKMDLALTTASMKWGWRGETLSGNADISLVKYGDVKGSFHLPLPAQLPVSFAQSGTLQASVDSRVREQGILSSLFPGMVRESGGEAEIELRVNGSWREPQFTGNIKLGKAGAYLPSAGIHPKDVQLIARLEKGMFRIVSLRATSGSGSIEGNAEIALDGWRVKGYKGKLDGKDFQTIHFPELQLSSTPHLTFDGTPEKLSVRGELHVPELLINGPATGKIVQPSEDVVIEGRGKTAAKAFPIAVDFQVRVVLGDNVQVKTAGIDAKLAGEMMLTATGLDRITSKGEIRVVEGSYRTYGVNLDIERGRLYYAGGPINRPTLDFLALRTIGDVKAGVTVGGLIQKPVIKLYSNSAMSDADILSYIVLGHSLGGVSSTSQTDLLAQAAGALLSSSQATDLRSQIKSRLGLSTFGFETGSSATTGSIGYKAIQVVPSSVSQHTTTSESLLTVGKYLTPQLYISYGRSLFSGGNLIRLRYDIFKHWQIETQTGSESGGDIFFKFDFD